MLLFLGVVLLSTNIADARVLKLHAPCDVRLPLIGTRHRKSFQSTYHPTLDPSSLCLDLRGGSGAKDNTPNDSVDARKKEKSRRYSSPSWLRVFQLRNEVQGEASREPYVVRTTSNTSRGGAVVTAKPARGLWMFSSSSTRTAVPPPHRQITSVRRLWWVNTWSDQLPSTEEEREAMKVIDRVAEETSQSIGLTKEDVDDDSVAPEEPKMVQGTQLDVPAPKKEESKPRSRRRDRRKRQNDRSRSSPKEIDDSNRIQTQNTTSSAVEPEPTETPIADVKYPLLVPLPGRMNHYVSAGYVSDSKELRNNPHIVFFFFPPVVNY